MQTNFIRNLSVPKKNVPKNFSVKGKNVKKPDFRKENLSGKKKARFPRSRRGESLC